MVVTSLECMVRGWKGLIMGGGGPPGGGGGVGGGGGGGGQGAAAPERGEGKKGGAPLARWEKG